MVDGNSCKDGAIEADDEYYHKTLNKTGRDSYGTENLKCTNSIENIENYLESMMEEALKELKKTTNNEFQKNANNIIRRNGHLLRNGDNQSSENKINGDNTNKSSTSATKDNIQIENNSKRKINAVYEKVFIARNSLLTDLLEIPNIKTIYNLCFIAMFLLLINTLAHDYLVDGTFNIGINPILDGFAQFHIAFGIWTLVQLSTFLVHPTFKLWAIGYHFFSSNKNKSSVSKRWNRGWLGFHFLYLISILFIGAKTTIHYRFPVCTSVALLTDIARLAMKSHAYVSTNCRKVFRSQEKRYDGDQFSKYLYFLFAPTIIYRDNYPRTEMIRWKVVAQHLLEMIGTMLFMSFLFERFMLSYFTNFGKTPLTNDDVIMGIFGCILPGFMFLILSFYCVLHSWLNFTSELTRFADRMFYQDWWTSTSFKTYYRKWNVVVQDWLYEYIYKDIYEYVFVGSKVAASIVTITISGLVHEFIIVLSFGYFYPILFVFFNIIGLIMLFVNTNKYKNVGNIFVLLGLYVGCGLMASLYTIEYFARQNCEYSDDISKYFIPISWTCNFK